MSEIFVTSDLHFFHNNILKYNAISRPFNTIEEMNDVIISNWNNMITLKDKTYILGDISFGPAGKTAELLQQLNGTKILIKGNHDSSYLKNDLILNCFESIHDYYELKYNKQFICMFHFPIEMWNRKHYGGLHFHGHTHSINQELNQRRIDVGLDGNNLLPYNIDDVVEKLLQPFPLQAVMYMSNRTVTVVARYNKP